MKNKFIIKFILLFTLIFFENKKCNGQIINLVKKDTLSFLNNIQYLNLLGSIDGNVSQKINEYSVGTFPDITRVPDFIPLDSLIIQNIDTFETEPIIILSNNDNNIYSIDSICKSAVKAICTTLDDTIYSIYDYVSTHNMYYFIPELVGSEPKEVTKQFGVYGYGHCGSIANCVAKIAERLTGIKSRCWYNTDGGHGWSEINIGNKWFFIDADECLIIKDINNNGFASYADYFDDLYLGFREKMFGIGADPSNISLGIYYQNSRQKDGSLVDFSTSMPPNGDNDTVGSFGKDLFYKLKPGESLKILASQKANLFHHISNNVNYLNSPPDSTNIMANIKNAIYSLNVLDGETSPFKKCHAYSNFISSVDNLKLIPLNNSAEFIIKKETRFPILQSNLIINSNLSVSDSIQIYTSIDSITWTLKNVLYNSLNKQNISLISFLENNDVTANYLLFIKIKFISNNPTSNIDYLVLNTTIQQSTYITPFLNLGLNKLQVLGNNTNVKLQIKTCWKEKYNVILPTPPINCIYPINNDTINETNINFEWAPANTNANGNSIVEYYFQLSEFPDFKTILCNQFNQYLDAKNREYPNKYLFSEYLLYASTAFDFYNSNKKYYWRIKARDVNNNWSSWSDTWSFVVRCPMKPNCVHFELTNNDSIYNLVWKKNNDGIIDNVNFAIYSFGAKYISPYNYWVSNNVNNITNCLTTKNPNNIDFYFRVLAYKTNSCSTPTNIFRFPKQLTLKYREIINLNNYEDSLQQPFSKYPKIGRKYFPVFDSVYFEFDTLNNLLIPIKTGKSLFSICYKNKNLDDTIYKIQYEVNIKKISINISPKDTCSYYGDSIINTNLVYNKLGYNQTEDDVFLLKAQVQYNIDTLHVGTYLLTCSSAILKDTNYVLNYLTGSYKFLKRKIKVIPMGDSGIYGQAIKPITINYSGFAYNETDSVFIQKPTYNLPLNSNSNVGQYIINTLGGIAQNYYFEYDTAIYKIITKTLTIKPNFIISIYGSTPLPQGYTYLGFTNGDTNTSFITQPKSNFVADSTSAVGTYIQTVSGATALNYTINNDTSLITILPKDLNIIAMADTFIYGQTPNLNKLIYIGFVNGDTNTSLQSQPILSTNATSTSSVGTYHLIVNGASSSNYNIIYTNNLLTIIPKELHLVPNNVYTVYGDSTIFNGITYVGFVNGDSSINFTQQPNLFTNTTIASNIGTYPIYTSGASSSNYIIINDTGTLQIGLKTLTIKPNSITSIYGNTPQAQGFTYIGFTNGDTYMNLLTQPITSFIADSTSKVGNYIVNANGASSLNYNIIYDSSILYILKKNLHIIPNPVNTIYGDTIISNNITYFGFVNGDSNTNLIVQPTLILSANSSSQVGTYQLYCTGGYDSNYHFIFDTSSIHISPHNLIIKASNSNSIYGDSVILAKIQYVGFVNGDTDII